ncbi:MAG TPA: hypothetical protein VMM77_06170 [Gemmatimonadaceae bacterium]|nr:hypothetical protein [Gemmatimonadaceae bacterium]
MRRALVLGVLVLAGAEARAQDTLEVPVLCNGQTITDVQVRTRPPFAPRDVPWYRAPLRVLQAMHTTTRPSVVKRYILMRAGDPCVELRRRETERLLRSYQFFASASVGSYDDGAGGVKIIVVTTDELTAVVDGSFRGANPTAVGLGERNAGGTGTAIIARWQNLEGRDGYGLALTDHQFLGLPYELELAAERGDMGERRWLVQMARPFLIEEQRRAWRVTATESDEVFPFVRLASEVPVMLSLSRRFIDAGGVIRLGPPGRLSLFGVSYSREEYLTGLPPRPDTTGESASLLHRYETRRNVRLNAIWGFRMLDFTEMERIDALTATQDIAHGVQVGLMFGRSLSLGPRGDDDIFIAGDLYIGVGSGRTFLRLDGRGEGRQNSDTERWDGILADGRLSLFQLFGSRHTTEIDVEWSGGWQIRSPYQLSLGIRGAGVRGYRRAREAGARRLVMRFEDRWLVDVWRDDADVAGAVFVDAGRLWAGNVPYGIDTPYRIGAGIAILAAVPSGSRRTYRLDLTLPVHRGEGVGWELRFSTVSVGLPLGWREPGDVSRSRERTVPTSIF